MKAFLRSPITIVVALIIITSLSGRSPLENIELILFCIFASILSIESKL